jgi:hypothetical protein
MAERAGETVKSQAPSKRSWRRRAAAFAIAFAVSLIVGRFFETLASKPAIDAALRAQSSWMEALNDFSPWGVAKTFSDRMSADIYANSRHMELNSEGRLEYVDAKGGAMDGLMRPMKALFDTVLALATTGGVVGLMQLGMGVLAVGLALVWRKRVEGKEMAPVVLVVLWPAAVIFAASLIALVLKALMVGALGALSWATELAAGAAGATGVVGFCWYCLQKLGEKGAEHALTPKI